VSCFPARRGASVNLANYRERYKHFLMRLRKARKQAKLSQYDVAAALGRHQSFVSKIETGERRLDVIELTVFAALYKKPLDWFVNLSEEDD